MSIIYKVIEEKIINKLKPDVLIISDVSHLHKGHKGVLGMDLDETHFDIKIVSDIFINKSRIERQRIIYKLLKKEGPPHSPMFTISLQVLNLTKIKAKGASIRDAERKAASHALSIINEKKIIKN